MVLIYNIAWTVNDFFNTLLLFIIYFSILPKSKSKLNFLSAFIICILFTILDSYPSDFSDLSSFLAVFLAILFIRSSYKAVDQLIVWFFSLLLVIITQGLGSVVILSAYPSLSDPKTAIQSVLLFTILSILNYIFSFATLYLLKSFNKKYHLKTFLNDSLIKKIILIALIILNLFYIALDNLTKYLNVEQKYIKITTLIITITIIFIATGITMLVYSHFREMKTKLKIQQMNERDAYINELEKSNNELRKFKHDYKNLLLSLSISSNDNKNLKLSLDKLLNYKRMNLKTDSNKTNLYNIKDKLVKGILISKLIYASNNDITVNFEVDNNVNIPSKYSVDITRILGILLDNSIEACKEVSNPTLNFALISFDGYIEFVTKNSINPDNKIELNKIYSAGYSTKSKHSGLGLATINEIVNSNDNLLLQTKIKDGYYSTILTVLED